MNEELQTVNAELQSKVDDYTQVNNDMKNLLNSTDIATLFLDKELNIRNYTDQATNFFKLIKTDIGRPLTDLVSQLIYPNLVEDAFEVLRTLVFIETQVPTNDDRWFSTRIMPYRTFDDKIDGIVITFINISDLKEANNKLNETKQLNNLLLQSTPDVVIQLSPNWKIIEFNSTAEKFLGIKRNQAIDSDYIELFVPEVARNQAQQQMSKLLKQKKEVKVKIPTIVNTNEKEIEWTANVVFDSFKQPVGLIITTKI